MGLRIGEYGDIDESTLAISPVIADTAFDNNDCERALKAAEIIPSRVVTMDVDKEKLYIFNSTFIPYNDETAWLYGKVYDLAISANEEVYKFNPLDMVEHIVYMDYYVGCFLDWHLDLGQEAPHAGRKLTMIINLNDSDDYRGGDLQIMSSDIVEVTRSKGSCIFYPSYLKSKIRPVTKGNKKILVAWFGGTNFK
jgi:PKHD-type hydroxylase